MKGSDSDHNIIVFAPLTNTQFKKKRQFTNISYRPLPPSKIQEFGQEFVLHPWQEVLECEDGHQKAANFHETIQWFRDKYFPEKIVRMSSFDKGWMHPDVKSIYLEMTKEYFRHRKSDKWRKLYVKFRKAKRRAIRGMHFEEFADQIIKGTKSNFYRQVKKVGGLKPKHVKMNIASLEGKSDMECAEAIGEQYAAISQAYSPVDLSCLPAFLPAQQPPQVNELQVWGKLNNLKKTKSTAYRPTRKTTQGVLPRVGNSFSQYIQQLPEPRYFPQHMEGRISHSSP